MRIELSPLLLLSSLALLLSACPSTDGPIDEDMGSSASDMSTQDMSDPGDMPPVFPDFEQPPEDMGPSSEDMPIDEEDMEIVQDFPNMLTTNGAQFGGVLEPNQRVEIALRANAETELPLEAGEVQELFRYSHAHAVLMGNSLHRQICGKGTANNTQ